MELGGGIWRNINMAAALPRMPQGKMIDHGAVYQQPLAVSLLDHPVKREFRQSALGFSIPPADISMYPGKPDLPDILGDF